MEMQRREHIQRRWRRKNKAGLFWQDVNILPDSSKDDEWKSLRQKVQLISQRLERIKKRVEIPEIKPDQNIIAVVDREECAGCGICYDVCPVGAISMDITARIDSGKCTACLECVNLCPRGAIAIKYQND
jgi:ferredoxin